MKVKYIGDSTDNSLKAGEIYTVLSILDGLYEIEDEGEYSIWQPENFEITEGSVEDVDLFEFDEDDTTKK